MNAKWEKLHGMNVLILDDSRVALDIAVEQLTMIGANVIATAKYEEALELLKDYAAKGNPFDFAIIDHQMPGMSGPEFMESLRLYPSLKGMQAILLTSQPYRGDARKVQQAGFLGYLTKPVHPSELPLMLAMLFEIRQSMREPTLVTRYRPAGKRIGRVEPPHQTGFRRCRGSSRRRQYCESGSDALAAR